MESCSQLVRIIDILGRDLKIFGELEYSHQTSLSEALSDVDEDNPSEAEIEFYKTVEGCKFYSTIVDEVVKKWEISIPDIKNMNTQLLPVFSMASEYYFNALSLVKSSTNEELKDIIELANCCISNVNKINLAVTLITRDYGPITNLTEINKVIEPYKNLGANIIDLTLTKDEYSQRLTNLSIVNHKICALLKKMEQGGNKLCSELCSMIHSDDSIAYK